MVRARVRTRASEPASGPMIQVAVYILFGLVHMEY
jgi:hypothetical protein